MLAISVHTTGLRCHVYVNRWTAGASTPERVIDIVYDLPGALTGRASLRLAIERILRAIDELPER